MQLTVMTWCATATTTIGCFLALFLLIKDALQPARNGRSFLPLQLDSSEQRDWVARSLTVLPPLAVASAGPQVFLLAIAFAGEYPVVALWGFLPSLLALELYRGTEKEKDSWWLYGMMGLSTSFLFSCLAHDVPGMMESVVSFF